MTKQAKHPGYVVTLRPERYLTEDEGLRALRAFLKSALRSYGLRCTAVVPRIDADALKGADATEESHTGQDAAQGASL